MSLRKHIERTITQLQYYHMYIVGITSLFLYFIFVFFKYVRVTLTQGYHETTLCIPDLFYKRQIDPKGNCEELTEWPISDIEERVAIHI